MHGAGSWGFAGLGFFWWVIVLAVIVLVVIWAVRSGGRGRTPAERESSAEEVLRKRYARGEIDSREYQQRLENLRR